MPFLFRCLSAIFFVSLFTACNLHRLSVQTQYLSSNNLASYYVETPDPQLQNPPTGQRLFIQWCLPNRELQGKHPQLFIRVRLKNNQEDIITTPILIKNGKFSQGYYVYERLGSDYYETGGILTYIIQIVSEEEVIELWQHPLWVNLIEFDSMGKPAV